ncbi:MAG: hypothetical protein ACXAD7_26345 [Candidatus Kariarchaeaceae archaeon]|jgi:hypothetical protein
MSEIPRSQIEMTKSNYPLDYPVADKRTINPTYCTNCSTMDQTNNIFCGYCGKRNVRDHTNIDPDIPMSEDGSTHFTGLPFFIRLSLNTMVVIQWLLVIISFFIGLVLLPYGGFIFWTFTVGFYYSAINFSKLTSRGKRITNFWLIVMADILTLMSVGLVLENGILVLVGADWMFFFIVDILLIYQLFFINYHEGVRALFKSEDVLETRSTSLVSSMLKTLYLFYKILFLFLLLFITVIIIYIILLVLGMATWINT